MPENPVNRMDFALPSLAAGEQGAGGLRKISTLLVDDDAALRYLFKKELERWGGFAIVAEAENGAEGIRQAELCKSDLDLVLLDLEMPVMKGMEALPQIRRALPQAAIVILTMHRSPAAESEALRLGVTAFLDKRLDADSLAPRLFQIAAPRLTPQGGPGATPPVIIGTR